VRLFDRDKVVLGSLTEIGANGQDGMLDAPNGVLLEDGKTLVGQGEVDTANGQFRNNGFVQAEGTGITFNNLVTGIGDFGGDVTFDGGHSPGLSPAQIDLLGTVTYTEANVLTIEIGGSGPGSEFDRLDVAGVATLGGELAVELIDGFTPSDGDRFMILTAGGGVSGTFDTETLPDLSAAGLEWAVIYNANDVTLGVTDSACSTLPADLTCNGFVDFQDLTILLAAWNQNVSAAEGNLVDAAGTPVNFQDLTVLLAAWTGPGPAAAAQAATGTPVGRRLAAAQETMTNVGAELEGDSEREAPRQAAAYMRRTANRSRAASGIFRRLQATAVDRAMEEPLDSTLGRRTSRFVRRR
jgi:hypothetical protein